jgi:hypothetical protein
MNSKFIECSCLDISHVLRIHNFEDDHPQISPDFELEFKINRFAKSINTDMQYMNNTVWDKLVFNRLRSLYRKWLLFINYFIGIKNAIFGLPGWYTADILISSEEALKMCVYIQDEVNAHKIFIAKKEVSDSFKFDGQTKI